MRRDAELEEGHHEHAAGLEHAVCLAEIAVDVLLREMREDGEEAHEVGDAAVARNRRAVGVGERPVRPLAQFLRVFQQTRHDVAAEVAQRRKRRELAREASTAAANVDHNVVILQPA